MRSVFILGALFLAFFSCNTKEKEVSSTQDQIVKIETKKWPKKLTVAGKAATILSEWPEFNAFDSSFDAIYGVEGKEDLILIIEDLIEKQKLLAKSKYPEDFNLPQVKSRQKIALTYLLKTKGDLEYQINAEESVIAFINAYNAMRNQFNVLLNNTLNNKLILDEE